MPYSWELPEVIIHPDRPGEIAKTKDVTVTRTLGRAAALAVPLFFIGYVIFQIAKTGRK